MATATVPARPSVPAVPARPSAPAARPNASALPTAPVVPTVSAPGATVPAPPAQPVAQTVAPVATVAPTNATPAATPEKKKRGRVAKQTELYYGTIAYDEAGAPLYDVKDGAQVLRRVKLTSVPTDFNSDKHTKLESDDFEKLGDYYRHLAALAQKRVDGYLADAKLADEGKNTSKQVGKLAKVQSQMSALLETLKATLSPEDFAATCTRLGVDVPA